MVARGKAGGVMRIFRSAMAMSVLAASGAGGYACAVDEAPGHGAREVGNGGAAPPEARIPSTRSLVTSAGGYRAAFSEKGATLTHGATGARFSIRAVAVGRPGATRALVASAPTEVSANHATYRHGGVAETFDMRASGVEHGFVVDARSQGDGPLVVDIETTDDVVPGLEPTRPRDAVLRRPDGEVIARYGGLAANDADGRELPASFELAGSRLRVRVEDAAARYPVAIDPLIWAQSSRLLEIHSQAEDFFGGGLGLDDKVMIAGISGRDSHRGGAAFFDRSGATWTETSSYAPGQDASAPFQERGISAAIEGETAITGSALHATAFARDPDGGAWQTNGFLNVPSWNTIGGQNGVNVALSGDTAVLSVPYWSPNYGDAAVNPPGTPSGALFVYGRTGGVWSGKAALPFPASPAGFSQARVALQNDTIAVTTGFVVYVFTRSAGEWSLQATLLPPMPSKFFFDGIGLDGDTLLAPTTVDGSFTQNFATFFERSGTTWSVTASIAEPSPQTGSNFGFAAALRGDVAFVSDWSRNGPGSAFRFSRAGGIWALDEEIVPQGGQSGDGFGFNLAMTKDTAVFAATFNNFNRGALYVYEDRASLGDACKSGDACASGRCVDGVCCDTTCGGGAVGDCLACNVASHLGTCSPEGKTHTCRASVGDCDVAEVCDGTNIVCPADAVLANGAVCGVGHCVAGLCAVDSVVAPAPSTAPAAPIAAPSSDGGCGVARARVDSSAALVAFALVALLVLARRRRAFRAAVVAMLLAGATVTFDARPAAAEVVRLTATSFGRGAELRPLPPGNASRAGARVAYGRGPVVEWYETRPNGVEHGFDIAQRPEGNGPLVLRLGAVGARPLPHARGDAAIELVAPSGERYAYGALEVTDAIGRRLPSTLASDASSIEIRVDDADARYPIVVDPLVWRQRQTFAPAGLKGGDFFGAGGLVIQGTTAYVSTAADVTNLGRVDTYNRVVNDWVLGDEIFPADPQAGQGFGSGISVSGDTLAVGAYRDTSGHGAAYVFVKSAMGFTQEAKILPPSANDSYFGWTVALAGDTLAVSSVLANGSAGAVYIYTRSAGVWTLGQTLTGDVGTVYFGSSVAFTDTTLAIGAGNFYAEGGITTTPGSAYFYTGAGAAWTLQQRLRPAASDPIGRSAWFGTYVAIDGDTAVVSNGLDFSDPPQGGRAYVYARADGVWTPTQMLQPSDTAFQDNFSSSGSSNAIILHGDKMLVGAVGGNGGFGEAYLFSRSGGVWTQTTQFVNADAKGNQDFGSEADFTDDMVLIGAGGGVLVPGGPGAGKVYAFFHGSEGDPCTSGAPCSTGNCVDGVCCDSPCGGDPNDCVACSVAAGAAVDGTCGPTTPHVCRKARGDCDAPESCDGLNLTCPADLVAANGQVCSHGTCSGGQCLTVIPIEHPPTAAAPALPGTAPANVDGGCSCRAGGSSAPASLPAAALTALLIVTMLARRLAGKAPSRDGAHRDGVRRHFQRGGPRGCVASTVDLVKRFVAQGG